MDNVEIQSPGYNAGSNGVVVDFFKKIVGIFAGKFYASQIIGAHIVEIGIYMVSEAEIQVGIHNLAYAGFYIVAVYVAPSNRNLRCAYYTGKTPVFIAERFGDDECYVHIAAFPHSTGQPVACRSEPTKDVGREFPSEH